MDLAPLPPAVRSLLAADRLPELGPGRPNDAARATLRSLTPEALAAPHAVRDQDAAHACLAGLWLLHDFLDESHSLSQEIHTAEGSYWHGIMHRREPDYSNAKYWFRRVGEHAVFESLRRSAAALTEQAGRPKGSDVLLTQTGWDPFRFVDLVEASAGGEPCETLCRQIQRAECDLLFGHCYRLAVGQG